MGGSSSSKAVGCKVTGDPSNRKSSILTRTARRLASGIRWAGRPAGLCAGLVLDFLIEDVCVLCGCSDSKPGCGEFGGTPTARLLEPVAQPLPLGIGHIKNHPVCRACAADFDRARDVGILGWRTEPGTVETTRGERFPFGSATGVFEMPDGSGPANTRQDGPLETIAIVSPFMTNDNVLQIIHLVKFGRYRNLIDAIALAMASAARMFATPLGTAVVIVPVPMRPRDMRCRGFNQSLEIARIVADDLGYPVLSEVLRKTARTAPQSRTPHEDRARNVRGVFQCLGTGTHGQHVLLVDDLVTTGATAAACAAAVYAAGARRVTVMSFGRAV